MSALDVAVVATGTANTASVLAAFERLGARARLVQDSREVLEAAYLVLPGVGSFAAAAERLDELGLRRALGERIRRDLPTLTICLGLQLLCSWSEESPGARGLGLVEGRISAFGPGVRSPQLGWNTVVPTAGSRLLRPGWAYFANSYRLERLPAGWNGALTDHGGSFVSALERGKLLACQFHPELSGNWGAELLDRWMQVEATSSQEVTSC